MANTPITYFSDPRKKALDHLNSECFALEQLAKQYGHPDIQHALYRVRATEMAHADTFLRGQIRREVDAAAGVTASGLPQQWEALIEEAVDAFAEGKSFGDRLPNAMAALRAALACGVAPSNGGNEG